MIRKYWIFAVILYVFVIHVVSVTESLPGDSKATIILAKSISCGKGFRDVSDVREPLVSGAAPLFILLLSKFPGYLHRIIPLKLFSLAGIFLSFFIIYKLLSFYIKNKTVNNLIFALIITNPFIFSLVNEVTTHAPYLLLSLLSIYYVYNSAGSSIRDIIITSILISLSFLTRWVGLSLFIAYAFYLLKDRKFKELCYAAIVFSLIAGGWIAYTFYLHITGKAAFLYFTLIFNPYNSPDNSITLKAFTIGLRFFRNLGGYFFRCLPGFIFGNFFSDINLVHFNLKTVFKMLIALIPSAIILLGFIRERKHTFILLLTAVYFSVLGMFAEPDIHYLTPFLPFFYIWMYSGILFLTKNIKYTKHILVTMLIISSITLYYRALDSCQNKTDGIYCWIAENTSKEAIFLDYKWFSPLYIYTERRTINILDHEKIYTNPKYQYKDPALVLKQYPGIKYILVNNDREETQFASVRNLVFNHPHRFKHKYTNINKSCSIYEVLH